jgi:cyclic dehypoxanthinyl futalosine synthase
VDYLCLLAGFRLHTGIEHIQVDVQWAGLKLAQVALRFGADDLVNEKPGSPITEEEIRRVIRDAGFIPKKRDREYRSLSIF